MVADHQAHAHHWPIVWSTGLERRLAREGCNFTRARTVLPICSPARASMLTGLYSHAHGVTENDGRFGGRAGLDPGDRLVHQPLCEAGYRCGWFGKWHVDNHRSAADYGFEGFSLPGYGYPYATAEYRRYLEDADLPSPVAEIEMPGGSGLAVGTPISLVDAADWFDFESGVARLHGPAEVHEAFFVSRLAEDWLESLETAPFFVRIDPWGPHPPYLLTAPWRGMFEPSAVDLSPNFRSDLEGRPSHHRRYCDFWRATLDLDVDGWRWMVARALEHVALVEAALLGVVDAVDRIGLADSTLVVFTADHGDAVGSNGGVCNKGGLFVMGLRYIQDRERIVRSVLEGHGQVGNDHPISPAYGADHCHELPQREFDPDQAKFHLNKSGYTSAELFVAPVVAGIEEACLLMQANLNLLDGVSDRIKGIPNVPLGAMGAYEWVEFAWMDA